MASLKRLSDWRLPGGIAESHTGDATTRNLASKAGVGYKYEDAAHAHAATGLGANSYSYDANGNMTCRSAGAGIFNLIYDAENRLSKVQELTQGPCPAANTEATQYVSDTFTFWYDGDGKRVKQNFSSIVTYFVGNIYEKKGMAETKYYYAGGARVAMRWSGNVFYLLSDHLGSTTVTTDVNGYASDEIKYKPWGEVRAGGAPTSYTFTGQYSNASDFGLMFYNARWYDVDLARMASADTIVPDPLSTQAYDRYAYTFNNPVRYTDPSGHCPFCLAAVVIVGVALLSADVPIEPVAVNYPINWGVEEHCSSSLPACFGDTVYLRDFSDHGEDNPIPIEEFTEFANKVAEDLYSHDLTWPGLAAGRGTYDTPFYNGGESERRTGDPESPTGEFDANQQVCIETIGCYGRSDVNYIAQGMCGAAVGEPKAVSNLITWTWKIEEYYEQPSEGARFWLDYGYDYFRLWRQERQQ